MNYAGGVWKIFYETHKWSLSESYDKPCLRKTGSNLSTYSVLIISGTLTVIFVKVIFEMFKTVFKKANSLTLENLKCLENIEKLVL